MERIDELPYYKNLPPESKKYTLYGKHIINPNKFHVLAAENQFVIGMPTVSG